MAGMDTIANLYHQASHCRVCFDEQTALKAPIINLAQPRWIGSRYYEAKPRIVFVTLNPGAGDPSKDAGNCEAQQVLVGFREGNVTFEEVLAFQRQHMESWGRPTGRFLEFYLYNLGLNLNKVAFLNIALCATRGNHCPRKMLEQCFKKYTKAILQKLNPDLVILCGVKSRRFESEISALFQDAKIEYMLHHAHRGGRDVEKRDRLRLRRIIKALKEARRELRVIIDLKLQRLVHSALDLGFHCFADGDQAPFIILNAGGEDQFMNLKNDDGTISETLVEAGRLIIRQHAKAGKYYILLWDGHLTAGGKQRDAVFAEVGEAGGAIAFIFAQRYKKTQSGRLSKLGQPLVVSQMPHLWSFEI